MKTLEKQLQGIIQNSVSKTMNIKIPLQENTEDRKRGHNQRSSNEHRTRSCNALRMVYD